MSWSTPIWRSRLRASVSAEADTWLRKSDWMRRVVRTPTMVAKPQRITSVRAAEPPASRQRIGRRLYAEDVPRAADRMEEPRLATGFQLPSQVGHEDLDRVGDRERVVAPHLVEQLLARDDQALVAHEVLEQLELALRELDPPLAARDLVGVRVEHEVADAQRRHAARRAAAQQRAHAGQQLLALEGLDQAVVRAGVEPLDARLQRVARGEHEDRHLVAVIAQALGDVHAVEPGEPEVEHDEVGQERVRLLEAPHAVGREFDLVALQAQRALQDLGDLLVVLDDEHADGAGGGLHLHARW